MPTTSPRARTTSTDPLPTRHRILVAASRLFAQRGYGGTSTRDIAAAVELSQPTLFHHFATKSAMMTELLQLNFTHPATVVSAITREDGDPAALLFRELRWELDYTRTVPYDLTAANAADVLGLDEFAGWRGPAARLRSARRSVLRRGVDEGTFTVDDESVVLNAITAVMVDAVRRAGGKPGQPSSAHAVAGLLVRSVLSDQTRLATIATEAELHHDEDDARTPALHIAS